MNKYGINMTSKDNVIIVSDKTISELWKEIFVKDVVCLTIFEDSAWTNDKGSMVDFSEISIKCSTIESIYYIGENKCFEREDN